MLYLRLIGVKAHMQFASFQAAASLLLGLDASTIHRIAMVEHDGGSTVDIDFRLQVPASDVLDACLGLAPHTTTCLYR